MEREREKRKMKGRERDSSMRKTCELSAVKISQRVQDIQK